MILLVLYTDGEGKNKTKMEKKFLKSRHKDVDNTWQDTYGRMHNGRKNS